MIAPRHASTTPGHQVAAAGGDVAPHVPVIVEIGPGRGDFLFHLAGLHIDAHIIGIELRHLRFRKLLLRRGTTQNISLVWGDARDALPLLAAQHRITALYINFPDPWPKRRHTKHRLMQPTFVQLCVSALATNGELWFTTDHAPYAAATAAHFATCPALTTLLPHPIMTTDPDAFPTYFAQKWRRQGRTIYYQRYRKT